MSSRWEELWTARLRIILWQEAGLFTSTLSSISRCLAGSQTTLAKQRICLLWRSACYENLMGYFLAISEKRIETNFGSQPAARSIWGHCLCLCIKGLFIKLCLTLTLWIMIRWADMSSTRKYLFIMTSEFGFILLWPCTVISFFSTMIQKWNFAQ